MSSTPKKTIKSINSERTSSAAADDQVNRKYYYDDDHGYEVFDPDAVENEELPGEKSDSVPLSDNKQQDRL